MPYIFTLHRESLKRKYSIYVVVAAGAEDIQLYVGKVGDNREGCNPLISRCGNHFSYNKIHSQIRNKITDHEDRDYTYVFEHIDDYLEDKKWRRGCIDKVNELERWLNKEVQSLIVGMERVKLVNPFDGKYLSSNERSKRQAMRTEGLVAIMGSMVSAVSSEIVKAQLLLKAES
ncbi:hypothetical protein [Pseudomonas sp. B26(2017)]|uniref:hypothetical protein n=1 Tax=Pseudomonas sp. B26(2017) TaxID=1981732 RepID=UPI000A1D67BE|nr:hypothetical protein [Pseudomonas sp. B26(2017)]